MSEKKLSIQRINFIERRPFVFTYRKMALSGGAVGCLCLLLMGVQAGRGFFLKRDLEAGTQEVARLKEMRDKLLKEITKAHDGIGAVRQSLIPVFERAPLWSVLLREMTTTPPPSLWLAGLKSYQKGEETVEKPKQGAKETKKKNVADQQPMPLSPPFKRGLILAGKSERASSVPVFLKTLSDSPSFKDVILSSLSQVQGTVGLVYQFEVDVTLAPSQSLQADGGWK